MKKHLLIAGIAVLSTSAYATTTRLQALGQDTSRGSFFIDDNYNVFRNAANVNMYKNYMVTEWGTEDGNNQSGTDERQLEGGFFREAGSFTYGVYFNNESDLAEAYSQNTGFVTRAMKRQQNGLDLFFGGDMGIQWGARIHYASSKANVSKTTAPDDQAYDAEHSAMNISLGMQMGDLGAYANVGIKNEFTGAAAPGAVATAKNDKLEGSGSLNLGVNYKLGNMKVYADYSKGGLEYTAGDATELTKTHDRTTINVGVGHTHEVSSTARVFSQVAYYTETQETKSTADRTDEDTDTYIPVTIGFEADANSWLTIRGSVSQGLPFLNKDEDKRSDQADDNTESSGTLGATTFAAGATLNFGKLQIDGVISNGDDATAHDLNTDVLLSKVAVIYNF
jgi:hypothetical protein